MVSQRPTDRNFIVLAGVTNGPSRLINQRGYELAAATRWSPTNRLAMSSCKSTTNMEDAAPIIVRDRQPSKLPVFNPRLDKHKT